MRKKFYKLAKVAVLIFVFILILPGVVGNGANLSFPKVKEKKNLDINYIAFNTNKKVIYGVSFRDLYILDSQSLNIKKKINVLNSSYPSIYHISGIGFNLKTNKLYIAAFPDKIIVMNTDNYQILKTLRTSSPSRPYYEVSSVYVDVSTNIIYVETLNMSSANGYIPLYAVINGKNDTLSSFISYGTLDFKHNAILKWSKNMDNFTIIVRNLSNWKIEKKIITPISQLNGTWENPSMHIFGDRLYIKSYLGDVLVYDMKNYKLLHYWKSIPMYHLDAYDQKNNVIYGVFGEWINFTVDSEGIRAINADTGKTVEEIKNMSYISLLHPSGKLLILGIDSSAHLLYVTVQKDGNSPTYLVIYDLSSKESGSNSLTTLLIIVSIAVAIIAIFAVSYVYIKKHK